MLVVCRQHLISPFPFLDDPVGIGRPDKRLGFAIVFAEVPVDPGLQVDERVEGALLQALADERGEKSLDHIGPGAVGGREMKRPARVPGEPGAYLGCLWAA